MEPQPDDQHVTVLLESAVSALNVRPDGVYLDGTYGRGGHSKHILAQLGPQGRLLAIDRDPQAVCAAKKLNDSRVTVRQCSFSTLAGLVRAQVPTGHIDGVLLDLGVCSPQLEDPQRGFSFLRDGPLDMRMDPTIGPTAAAWLNSAESAEITAVLKNFGEERFAKRIAAAIVDYRAQQPLMRTHQLAELISAAMPRHDKHKHAATRSFQAIRIHINNELGEIQQALTAALQILAPSGRLVVISFHSLEDRLVKRFMRQHSQASWVPPGLPLTEVQRLQLQSGCQLRGVGRQLPSPQEIANNPRARSAVLRIAERTLLP